MKKVLIYLSAVALTGTVLTSCNNDDDNVVEKVASSYEFTRDGKSTVMYDGQTARLKMVDELVSGLKKKDNSKEKLENMFAHQEGHDDFSDAMLNKTGKNIKSKVASSIGLFDGGKSALSNKIKEQFSGFISTQADDVFPRWDEPASAGVAGVLPDGKRRVSAKGYEADQMFKKGIIGGLILDQALNNYLMKVMKDDNEAMVPGYNFTNMEHHWDEAFGYIFGGGDSNVTGPDSSGAFPKNNEFIKYANAVNRNPHFKGISGEIFSAFALGRKAIVEKDYAKRDKAIKVIQANASKVVAVRGVFYLLGGAEKIKAGTRTSAFHGLSEGLGFVYSLQFTHNPDTGKPYCSHEEVEMMLDKLLKGDGLWTVSAEDITSVAKQIADKFGFTLEQGKTDAPE